MKHKNNNNCPMYTLGTGKKGSNTVVLTDDRLYFMKTVLGIEKSVHFKIAEIESVFFDVDNELTKEKDNYLLVIRTGGYQYPFLLNKKDVTEHNLRKLCQLFKAKKKSALYTMKTDDDLIGAGHELTLEPENLVKIEKDEEKTKEKSLEPELEQTLSKDAEKEKAEDIPVDTSPENLTDNSEGEEENELLKEFKDMETDTDVDNKEEPIKKEDSLFEKKEKPKKKGSLFGWGKKKESNTIILDPKYDYEKKDR